MFKIPYSLILCCAGESNRYKSEKLLKLINNKFLFEYSLKNFQNDKDCKQIILVIPKRWHIGLVLHLIKQSNFKFTYGGETRALSVKNGLKDIATKYVFIHDGARPFLTKKLILKMKKLMICNEKNISNIPLGIVPYENVDSLLINEKGKPIKGRIKSIQTPQLYISKEIKKEYDELKDIDLRDSSSLYTSKGYRIIYVENKEVNYKITNADDVSKYRKLFLP